MVRSDQTDFLQEEALVGRSPGLDESLQDGPQGLKILAQGSQCCSPLQ